MYVRMYVFAHINLCMHSSMYASMHVFMYVCLYVCMNVCMHARMHVCMYACMHVCMYACMNVCVCGSYILSRSQTSHRSCQNFHSAASSGCKCQLAAVARALIVGLRWRLAAAVSVLIVAVTVLIAAVSGQLVAVSQSVHGGDGLIDALCGALGLFRLSQS